MRQIFRPSLAALSLLSCAPAVSGSTVVWSESLNFLEFAGQPGGFASGAGTIQMGAGMSAPQAYDVLRPTGTHASGLPVYGKGQDGITDMTVRARVWDGAGGRWDSVRAGQTAVGGYLGGATMVQGTSRPGDWGLVALEFQLAPGLGVTAEQFALRLISANGTTEAYEWTMVTAGGMDDAPFSLSLMGSYQPTDYTDTGSGTYYNSMGGVTGLPGTGDRLATGRSMSQFLTGAAAAPVSGGLVQPGWFAVDDFNAWILDGPEADLDNPYAEDGTLDVNPLISGARLGLQPGAGVTTFTIWIGINDVGLDSDGDGFSHTDGNPSVRLAGLSLGASVVQGIPEPGSCALLGAAALLAGRRRRL
jgi:hypothetical protein